MKLGLLRFGIARYRQKYLQNERRAVSAATRFQLEAHLDFWNA